MLTPSHRHTAADLALWAELEVADLARAADIGPNGRRLDTLFARSANALTDFVPRGPCYCSVSWGKDSVVVAHLLRCTFPHAPLVHLRPTNHNPDCDAVRDAYFAAFPGQPYFEIGVDYAGIPHEPDEVRDRETNRRWFAGFRDAGKRFGTRYVTGVRADESAVRRLRCRSWGEASPNTCAPLAWWSAADVFAYLAANALPVHPVYAMLGNGRWRRDALRTSEVGDTHGRQFGRLEHEREYYGDVLRRLAAAKGTS